MGDGIKWNEDWRLQFTFHDPRQHRHWTRWFELSDFLSISIEITNRRFRNETKKKKMWISKEPEPWLTLNAQMERQLFSHRKDEKRHRHSVTFAGTQSCSKRGANKNKWSEKWRQDPFTPFPFHSFESKWNVRCFVVHATSSVTMNQKKHFAYALRVEKGSQIEWPESTNFHWMRQAQPEMAHIHLWFARTTETFARLDFSLSVERRLCGELVTWQWVIEFANFCRHGRARNGEYNSIWKQKHWTLCSCCCCYCCVTWINRNFSVEHENREKSLAVCSLRILVERSSRSTSCINLSNRRNKSPHPIVCTDVLHTQSSCAICA